jgi:FtsP/CotA-like multicopper oxidase with cupredoxin domain
MPSETFVYEFLVSHAGTFMFHSHGHNSAEQIDRGLYGFLVVDPQEEPSVQFDGEYFMALQGWMVGHGGPMMGPAAMVETSGQVEAMHRRLEEMAAEIGHMDQRMRALVCPWRTCYSGGKKCRSKWKP